MNIPDTHRQLSFQVSDVIRFILLLSLFLFPATVTGIDSVRIGDPAPTFILKDLSGTNKYLRDFCGELRSNSSIPHVVILSFFATWCTPCRHEIPILEKFNNDFKQENIKIFLVDVGEENDKVRSFVSANNITLPILLDSYVTTAKNYGVADSRGSYSLPQLFIIDREGKINYISKGISKKDNFRKILIEKVGNLLN